MKLAGTVLQWISWDHLEQQEQWRTGTVENTGTTKVGKQIGKMQWGQAWFSNVNGRPDSE